MSRFEDFADRKTRDAAAADIRELSTLLERRHGPRWRGIGNTWSRQHFGGEFGLFVPDDGHTALSLVFVQSSDGNTGAADPSTLGGGATDAHLIYEGLSRVAADAVLAGAGTVHRETFFSVWHPELVALRRSLGLPRHPAQVVISAQGRFDLEALLFQVPEVPVFLVAGPAVRDAHQDWLRARPWIRHVPLTPDGLAAAFDQLRVDAGLRRISSIGGRLTASRLVDAGLAQDIYLTTTSREGGTPGTPWYSGPDSPELDVVTRKRWVDQGAPVLFEHALVTRRRAADG